MCSLTLGLIGASVGMNMYSQNMQAKAQQTALRQQQEAQIQAYNLQKQQAEQNAAIQSHKSEVQAESYAEKQKQLNNKYRLAVGQARAAAASSGISSDSGSLMDNLDASTEAYNSDTQNLLRSQREDSWASYIQEVNFRNAANTYDAQAINANNYYNQMIANSKSQARINMVGTALSGAASLYGQGAKEGIFGGSSSSNAIYSGSSLSSSTRGYNFNNLSRKSANYGMSSSIGISGY